jgi:hypothetical protein
MQIPLWHPLGHNMPHRYSSSMGKVTDNFRKFNWHDKQKLNYYKSWNNNCQKQWEQTNLAFYIPSLLELPFLDLLPSAEHKEITCQPNLLCPFQVWHRILKASSDPKRSEAPPLLEQPKLEAVKKDKPSKKLEMKPTIQSSCSKSLHSWIEKMHY